MTMINCPSDCMFSANDERACQLKEVMLKQTSEQSPNFVCANYIKGNKPAKYASIDIDNSRLMGVYKGLNERLRNAY